MAKKISMPTQLSKHDKTILERYAKYTRTSLDERENNNKK